MCGKHGVTFGLYQLKYVGVSTTCGSSHLEWVSTVIKAYDMVQLDLTLRTHACAIARAPHEHRNIHYVLASTLEIDDV